MDKFLIRKKPKPHNGSDANSASRRQHSDESTREEDPHQPQTKRTKIEPPLLDQPKPKIRKIRGENLDCDYMKLFSRKEADALLQQCEDSLEYFTGDLAKIKVFGKVHDIPRKQVAHGDTGLTYRYSGVTVPAKPWTPLLLEIKARIQDITGYKFNFVLINRYADGNNYMGEHRDDEKELVMKSPIASLSLGQHRDFIFRHCEARGAQAKRKSIAPVKVELEHGSLLMMNYPTNVYWYHSLPVRKNALNTRVNMTFTDIVNVKK